MSLNVGDLVAELKVDKTLWNAALSSMPREVARQGGLAETQARQQGGRIAGGLGQSFKNALGGGLVGGAIASVMYSGVRTAEQVVGAGLKALKADVFDFNSTLQNSMIAFTTMLGSGTKAKGFLDQLQAFAKSTPFEFQGLVKNAQLMMGMGVSAKDVIPYLTALGDSTASVGGDANTLNTTILAFSQTMAKGKLDMGNMNQMLQGGMPQALKVLAASYGVTTGKMVQMISTGQVASADALPRLVKGIEQGTSATAALGGMMDKQSRTWTGATSNISDATQQLLAKAFRPLFNEATGGAMNLASALGSAKADKWAADTARGVTVVIGWFRRVKVPVKEFFDGFTKGVDSFGSDQSKMASYGAQVYGALATIGSVAKATWTNLGPLVPAALAVFTAFSPLGLVLKALGPVLPVLAAHVSQLTAAFGSGLSAALVAIAPALITILDVVVRLASPILESKGAVLAIVGALVAWKLATLAMGAYKAIYAGYAAATYGVAGAEMVAGNARKVYSVITKGMAIAQGVATAAQWALNAAMDANPIGLILLAVAGLTAGLVWFFTQTKLGKEVWTNVTRAIGSAWTWLATAFQVTVGAIGKFLAQWGPTILAVIAPVIGIPLLVIQHWNQIVAFFRALPGVVGRLLVAVGRAMLVGIATGIALAVVAVHYFFTKFPSDLLRWTANAAVWLVQTGAHILQGLASGVTHGYIAVTAWFRALPGRILAFVVTAATWYVNTGRSITSGLVHGVTVGWRAVVAWFRRIPGWVVGFVTGAARWYVNTGTSLLRGLASGASSGWHAVSSFLGALPGRVIGFLAGAPHWLVSAGVNVVQGFLGGIRSMAGGIGSFFLSLLPGWIVGPFKAALGIASPSKLFHTFGAFLMHGLGNGIAAGAKTHVARAMGGVTDMLKNAALHVPLSVGGAVDPRLVGAVGVNGPNGAPSYHATSSLVIHGNVGWDPHEVARQTAQRQRQAAALAGFTTGAGVMVA